MVSIIVAVAENNVIGNNNDLIWHLPNDLKYFKQRTSGNTIIMGRKTFESIGKPLPNRENIIITRNESYQQEGCIVVNSLDEAIKASSSDETFIIGGGEIYKQALPLVDKIYYTKVKQAFEGDTYFPELSSDKWTIESVEEGIIDEKNKIPHQFLIYSKIG